MESRCACVNPLQLSIVPSWNWNLVHLSFYLPAGTINRTIVELKCVHPVESRVFPVTINRTIVELKCWKHRCHISNAVSINRTIVELKYWIQSFLQGVCAAINRTIVELKCRGKGRFYFSAGYQSYHRGIEINYFTCKKQQSNYYQSYHRGIEITEIKTINSGGCGYQSYHRGIEIFFFVKQIVKV